jgi:hypothetical protein
VKPTRAVTMPMLMGWARSRLMRSPVSCGNTSGGGVDRRAAGGTGIGGSLWAAGALRSVGIEPHRVAHVAHERTHENATP